MPVISNQEDKLAVTNEEVFKECAERLKRAIEHESENRSKGIRALEFRDGQQWPDDLYNQRKIDKRPSLTINHTNTFCRRVVNNMRQQRPRIKVHPVGDGAQIQEAQVIEGIIRHIENMSNAQVAYDTGGESAVNIGWGYARVLTDYIDEKSFDQEVKIAPVRNTFTGYIDPAATLPDGSDMDWFIFTEKMKRSDFEREYPKEAKRDFQHIGMGDDLTDWDNKEEIRLAEYFRVYKRKDTLYRMTNGMSVYASDMGKLKADLAAAQVTIAVDANGRDIKRDSFKREIQWFRVNGTDIVDKRILPGRYIPVVRFEGNVLDLNGRVRRKGMVADMMDPARMTNYWKTCNTEILALQSKAPYVGARGQFEGHPEWSSANQKPHAYLEYEPVFLEQPDGTRVLIPPPQRAPPIAVNQGFTDAAMSAYQDLLAVAGMPHEPSADTPGTVVSGVALRKRQALSDIGHFQYYDNQTQAIAQIGRICLDYIPIYYSTERMQRIIGEDGVPSMVGINQFDPAIGAVKNDLTVGRYDVVMDTGPGYETKRIEGAEAMIDLLKTPLAEPIAKVGADLVVRNMDFAGASDLADRLAVTTPQGMEKVMEGLPKQAQTVVKSLMTQVQQLQQQNQVLSADLKYGLTKTHLQETSRQDIERMHDARAEKDTAVESETKRFDTQSRVHGQIAVAEIKEGGHLLAEHVKGKFAGEAREDELAAMKQAEKQNGSKEDNKHG